MQNIIMKKHHRKRIFCFLQFRLLTTNMRRQDMDIHDKLTKNFSISEFSETVPSDFQMSMLRILAENIQKVRDALNLKESSWRIDSSKEIQISINNGFRTIEDYYRLIKEGYNPSKTSDHFFGLSPFSPKPSLGAADIKLANCKKDLLDVHAFIIELYKAGTVKFGQIIYEKGNNNPWIHLGNDWTDIFSSKITGNTRIRFLCSLDNGKTYQERKM
jgi:hypothetical protein